VLSSSYNEAQHPSLCPILKPSPCRSTEERRVYQLDWPTPDVFSRNLFSSPRLPSFPDRKLILQCSYFGRPETGICFPIPSGIPHSYALAKAETTAWLPDLRATWAPPFRKLFVSGSVRIAISNRPAYLLSSFLTQPATVLFGLAPDPP
jgi:hypothetical protein